MALTLTIPIPVERQLTESKWDAAEQLLQVHPEIQSSTVLQTPTHVYTVVRTDDGAVSRVRTKSQEETNVDLASPLGSRGLLPVLVGSSSNPTVRTGM